MNASMERPPPKLKDPTLRKKVPSSHKPGTPGLDCGARLVARVEDMTRKMSAARYAATAAVSRTSNMTPVRREWNSAIPNPEPGASSPEPAAKAADSEQT